VAVEFAKKEIGVQRKESGSKEKKTPKKPQQKISTIKSKKKRKNLRPKAEKEDIHQIRFN
jgi:hypothetical protein